MNPPVSEFERGTAEICKMLLRGDIPPLGTSSLPATGAEFFRKVESGDPVTQDSQSYTAQPTSATGVYSVSEYTVNYAFTTRFFIFIIIITTLDYAEVPII